MGFPRLHGFKASIESIEELIINNSIYPISIPKSSCQHFRMFPITNKVETLYHCDVPPLKSSRTTLPICNLTIESYFNNSCYKEPTQWAMYRKRSLKFTHKLAKT